MQFTFEEKKGRRMCRLAQLIHDHWEEDSGMDTNIFQYPLIHDVFVTRGRSVKGGEYREHVVPRVFIRDECLRMFENGSTIEEVKEMLIRYLWIVLITEEEAERLNQRYKTTMPEGWIFGEGDPLARLRAVDINLQEESA